MILSTLNNREQNFSRIKLQIKKKNIVYINGDCVIIAMTI